MRSVPTPALEPAAGPAAVSAGSAVTALSTPAARSTPATPSVLAAGTVITTPITAPVVEVRPLPAPVSATAAGMAGAGIGRTPLLDLSAVAGAGRLLMKAEFLNPFGSSKDRAAYYLYAWAREIVGDGVTVVESTSGNLGVALSALGAELGFSPVLIVDTTVSERQRARIAAGSARVELVRAPRPGFDMRQTRMAMAREIGARPGHVWLNQYGNEANIRAHVETTGPELWAQTGGELDVLVAPISTGGTVCGLGGYLKSRNPAVELVGVEPRGSSIFGGDYEASFLIAGAGMRGPCELTVAHGDLIDRYAKVPDEEAAAYAVFARERFGLPVGLSTGAALRVAVQEARAGRTVAVVAPDTSVGFPAEIGRLAALTPPAEALPPVEVLPAAGIPWAALYEKENAT